MRRFGWNRRGDVDLDQEISKVGAGCRPHRVGPRRVLSEQRLYAARFSFKFSRAEVPLTSLDRSSRASASTTCMFCNTRRVCCTIPFVSSRLQTKRSEDGEEEAVRHHSLAICVLGCSSSAVLVLFSRLNCLVILTGMASRNNPGGVGYCSKRAIDRCGAERTQFEERNTIAVTVGNGELRLCQFEV